MRRQTRLLWPSMLAVDFFAEIERLDVPVYLLAGRHDYQVPAVLAERFYEHLDAPHGKRFVWFEQSGHLPNYEEPARFTDVLVHVKRETQVRKASVK